MTVSDVINQYNDERENAVPDSLKIRWLMNLEKKLVTDIFRKYDGEPDSGPESEEMWISPDGCLHLPDWMYVDENGVLVMDSQETVNVSSFIYRNPDGTITIDSLPDEEFGMDTELSIPDPFVEVYLYFIDMKVSYNCNDGRRYNIAAQEYNNAYLAFQQYFNRTHRPDSPRGHLIRHEAL